ncbi:mannose-1-phosphate guanylyltransferase/mannose-6-phosphate isomerase [Hydrocarboniphaga effusa]|uniref:mannose-1-phosphate guanylyltransferase n=2 Tax=Hydrocarboniphaga TaxID=243627 RepID=I8T9C7_9GAMM|nr:mannose-1-phosphate guanylyltransferase/mannose-6-phosphate isomerase [Hydrocarboniphaga effusa]EIT70398.1 Xanthan biosynthesis protein xanB [Hydrocarboniphaga effusa AP103]
MIVPVLMAGGSGTRLWPLSREQYPKQFLKLLNERSLLQNTALRVARLEDSAPPLVIGGDAHRFVIAEQMREIGFDQATVMLEPEGRNTAPAAAVAAHYASTHFGPQALVFLLAADQAVENTPAFVAAVEAAAKVAATGKIVTFGIQPTHPETGFGYIKAGPAAEHDAFEVAAFVEKPVLEKAQAFLDEGGYYWNGGMFLFRADVFLDELKRLEPEMHAASLQSWNHAVKDIDFVRLEPTAFKRCRNESIDYAVMEKTANIALVPLDAGWDDVGSWTYLGKLPATDDAGNRVRGDVIVEDSQDNLVHASTRLVSLVGMKDTVVVETEDAVLVAPRERVQEVKKIVQKLKKAKRTEAETSPRVFRPWGSYETVALADRFQVKRIIVKPGQKLSLQMHHHRAEHWIVVSGTARVYCGEKNFLLTEDQSTYIPLGHTHRLENPGKVPLELIEVQSGAYLGEDDIVRFDDVYGRTPAKT